VNPNVMFELGFAVARNKRIWVVLESTRPAIKREYDQVRLLTGIGFCSYANSQDIVNRFFRDRPYDDLTGTVWGNHIQPLLKPRDSSSLVYLKNRHETEGARWVNETVARYQKKGLLFTLDDPNETRVIAQRQRVAQIPAHGTQSQLRRRLPQLEDCRSGCVLHGRLRLPANTAKLATHPYSLNGAEKGRTNYSTSETRR
jgi:hypothetical protein